MLHIWLYNPKMPEWTGQTIGKVRIDKYLARGGMAEVYLGTHLTLDRQVAVKVLHSFIEEDAELQDRFQREAKAVAAMRHPNIVQVFDFDTHEGHPYLVMEYIKGPALSTYLQTLHKNEIKLSFEQIGQLLRSIASGLDYAHAQGIIHRDIKPANILLHSKKGDFTETSILTKHIEPVITDFGLARIVHSGTQTASGLVSGTPAYMSPEQARGNKVDHRTDIYSLGIILYELISGRVPFEADSAFTIIFKHINEPPTPIDGISAELQAVIDKALTKFPEDRYNSAHELVVDFFRVLGLQSQTETIINAPPTRLPKPVSVPEKKSRLNPLLIGGVVLVCACLSFVVLSGVVGTGFFFLPKLTTSPSNASGIPPATESALATEPPQAQETASVGVLRFQDGAAFADQITITAKLDAPPEGSQYEVWLIDNSGEQSRSIGTLETDNSGNFTLTFVDPQSRNLLADYAHMEITVEPNPDNNPNPSGEVAYSTGIPGKALSHIRHLLVGTDETPNQIGAADGLKNTSILINQSAEAMLAAFEAGNRKEVRNNAEAIVNMIVGSQDASHIDWDGNGTVNDPGDGFGILVNGEQTGYVEATHHHSSYSADADDSTPEIRMHDSHVEACLHNIEEWSIELRDVTRRILEAPDNTDIEADVRTAAALANQILNGLDVNGNELIEPIEGEGGALTAYQHAYYMADMQILPGKDQIPAPGK